MKKNIKKLTRIFILSLIINSCGKQNSCEMPSKSIDTLSMNLDTLSNTTEKLEINGKTIESTFTMSIIPNIQAFPVPGFSKHCGQIIGIKLIDSQTKVGLFKDYTFEYYWFFSKESKLSTEDSRVEYKPDNTTVRLIDAAYVWGSDRTMVIKIKDKMTNKSYLLKSTKSD